MDEPTNGLHMADISRPFGIIHHLVERGNSVMVIGHNQAVIRQAGWIIDKGQEGESKGGEIIAVRTPGAIMEEPWSVTGQFLRSSVVQFKASAPGSCGEAYHG